MWKKAKGVKRCFFGGDSHCGHRVGLTPPEYQSRSGFGRWEQTQAMLYEFFRERVEAWKPFDLAFLNGDLTDGKGARSGGSELITGDRFIQAEIAYKAYSIIGAPRYRLVFGTPYHVGMEEDFEIKVCDEFLKHKIDADIGGHGFYVVNGRNIDMKHKIAGSSVHYGRATPLLKEIDANMFWALAEVEPMADIVIRSHVHHSLETYQDGKWGFILPSLQGLGDKYGSRQCSGIVDFGFLVMDIPENPEEMIRWKFEKIKGIKQRSEPEVL